MSGWIGVDLDGTLAHYDGWKGVDHVGDPIPAMLHRVEEWLRQDITVKIFTARVAVPEPDRSKVVRVIHEWCERHGLPRLDITNVKDLAMSELWDDRAVQVVINTGRPHAVQIDRAGYAKIEASQRFVSLWEMLKLDTRNILSALAFLGGALGEYNLFIRVSSLQAATLTNSLKSRAQVIKALQNIAGFAELHGMKAAHHVATDAANSCIELLAPSVPMDAPRANRVVTAIESAVRAFIADAQSRQFFAADAMADGYYESADKLVGSEVVDQFPSIQFDIEEAGKCLTFGLWTASVMHLMRVHECVLRVLAQHLGVEAKENWNSTLNDIEAALRLIKTSKDGSAAEQAAAEAGTHLRFVKNAHRNHVMHAQVSYDQKRARDIFDGTRAFLQHLARTLTGDAIAPRSR